MNRAAESDPFHTASTELHEAAVTLAMQSLLTHGDAYLFVTARHPDGSPAASLVIDPATLNPEAVHHPPYAGNLIHLRLTESTK